MITIGGLNKLTVIRKEPHGFYLEGDESWSEILLPNKYAPEGLKFNNQIEVFVYFDSKDIIIATTLKPNAMVGEFASLEVSSIEAHGVFLNWGLEKDLFVPFREQLFKMIPGEKYVVFVYIDNTNRIAASTRLTKYVDKSKPNYSEGDQVELLLCQETGLGLKAIIDGRYYGQIFKDDIIHNLKLGQKITGYIKKVRDDNKIDLSLRPPQLETRDELVDLILQKLKASGGHLDISAKSPAETINELFKVSRKKFKIALGYLYKKKIISITENGIKLN
jgi:predicted RNA-binding protein (virulence factor B family)